MVTIDPRGPAAPGGSITGNQLIDSVMADTQAMLAGGQIPAGNPGRGQSPFDEDRVYFSQPPRGSKTTPWLPRAGYLGDDSAIPSGLRDPSGRTAGERIVDPGRERDRERRADALRERQAETEQWRNRRSRLEELALTSGLVGEGYLPSELETIWQAAIDTAEASTRMGELVEPFDVLEHWANDPEAARQFVQAQPSAPSLEDVLGGEPASRTVVRTNTTTHLTDAETARAVAVQGLRQYLGRAPRDGEVEQYTRFLGSLERENPTVSTVTQQIEGGRTVQGEVVGGEVTDTQTETTGGAPNPAQVLDTFVEDEHSDEAYAYRLASQGDQLLRSLVGSLV